MLKYGNKDFRNLQEQVLKNAQDIIELKSRPLLEIEFVDELPETGEAGVLYLVPVEDGEDPNNYEEYIWAEDEWELIGSTAVDISNMVTTDTDQTITGTKAFTTDVYLHSDTGDSPSLIFERAELGDTYYDWKLTDVGGELVFSQNTGSWGSKYKLGASALMPAANSSLDLGADGAYFKEAKVNKYTVATSGYDISKDGSNLKIQADGNPIVFRGNVEPTVDATYSLGKSNVRWGTINVTNVTNDYSALQIKGKSGISFTCDNGSDVKPSTDAQITLGNASSRWKTLHLSHYVSWGNNVLIGKDNSNRFYVTGSDGATKLKVGASETLLATKFSPDQSNTYDLGRTAMRWNYAYVNYLVGSDDTVIKTDDIVTKPDYSNPDVFGSGTLDASGQGTIDMTQTGVPSDGLYMFTYNNCQCFLSLTSTMIQNASSAPIRCPCPMMYNGSAYPGILKIERAADVLTLTVATAGVGNVTPSGFGWQLIKVM